MSDIYRNGDGVAEVVRHHHDDLNSGEAETDDGNNEPRALLPRRIGGHRVTDPVDSRRIDPVVEWAHPAALARFLQSTLSHSKNSKETEILMI